MGEDPRRHYYGNISQLRTFSKSGGLAILMVTVGNYIYWNIDDSANSRSWFEKVREKIETKYKSYVQIIPPHCKVNFVVGSS